MGRFEAGVVERNITQRLITTKMAELFGNMLVH